MRIRFRGLAFLAVAAMATGTWAQEDPHANCAAIGWVPREILERPVPLRAGTGNCRRCGRRTTSPEARAFYRQGLNYLHGYVWIEGARSFHQAMRLDPELAMAHWGLSRVYSGLDDQDAAVRAAQRAQGAGRQGDAARAAPHRTARCSSSRRSRISATRRCMPPTSRRSTRRSRPTSTMSSCG